MYTVCRYISGSLVEAGKGRDRYQDARIKHLCDQYEYSVGILNNLKQHKNDIMWALDIPVTCEYSGGSISNLKSH